MDLKDKNINFFCYFMWYVLLALLVLWCMTKEKKMIPLEIIKEVSVAPTMIPPDTKATIVGQESNKKLTRDKYYQGYYRNVMPYRYYGEGDDYAYHGAPYEVDRLYPVANSWYKM